MKNLKRLFRLFFILLLLSLAGFGVGLFGFHNNRYQDKRTEIELAEKREDETTESDDQEP